MKRESFELTNNGNQVKQGNGNDIFIIVIVHKLNIFGFETLYLLLMMLEKYSAFIIIKSINIIGKINTQF